MSRSYYILCLNKTSLDCRDVKLKRPKFSCYLWNQPETRSLTLFVSDLWKCGLAKHEMHMEFHDCEIKKKRSSHDKIKINSFHASVHMLFKFHIMEHSMQGLDVILCILHTEIQFSLSFWLLFKRGTIFGSLILQCARWETSLLSPWWQFPFCDEISISSDCRLPCFVARKFPGSVSHYQQFKLSKCREIFCTFAFVPFIEFPGKMPSLLVSSEIH